MNVYAVQMNNKNIDTGWLIGGILSLAYSAFVLITGTYILDEDSLSFINRKESNQFVYYLHLVGSASIGVLLLYRSLLFIPSNKEFNDKYPKYLERRLEYQRQQFSVNFDRLSNVLLVIFLIFAIIMLISKIL